MADDDETGGPEAAKKLADKAKEDATSSGKDTGVDPDPDGGIRDEDDA